jgi:bifunctional non-homologous end joining protein LigD
MPKNAFKSCIPTRGTEVPAGADWIHEIKHDGSRLIVQREEKHVWLFTRNGHDWSGQFPKVKNPAHLTFSRVLDQFGSVVRG